MSEPWVGEYMRVAERQLKERSEKIAKLEAAVRERDEMIFTLQAMLNRAHTEAA